MLQTQNQPEYITATIKDWNHLLKEDEYKMIIVNILKNLVLLAVVGKKVSPWFGYFSQPHNEVLMYE